MSRSVGGARRIRTGPAPTPMPSRCPDRPLPVTPSPSAALRVNSAAHASTFRVRWSGVEESGSIRGAPRRFANQRALFKPIPSSGSDERWIASRRGSHRRSMGCQAQGVLCQLGGPTCSRPLRTRSEVGRLHPGQVIPTTRLRWMANQVSVCADTPGMARSGVGRALLDAWGAPHARPQSVVVAESLTRS